MPTVHVTGQICGFDVYRDAADFQLICIHMQDRLPDDWYKVQVHRDCAEPL